MQLRVLLCLFMVYPVFQTSIYAADRAKANIIIRKAGADDFSAIKALWIKSYARAYNLMTQDEIDALQKRFLPIEDAELALLKEGRSDYISLVAMHDNKIIGHLSLNFTSNLNEVYGRCIAIDPDFQNQKISYKLFAYCYQRIPTIKQAVCLTRNINLNAQKLYEYWGGKRVENPSWLNMLPTYPNINAAEWVGYIFDEEAMKHCCTRYT